MGGIEQFRYDGKRALVVGGATGIGAAVAQVIAALGGEVVVLDRAAVGYPVAKAVEVDLRDRSAIDTALAEVGSPVHALFGVAGVADGTAGLMTVNVVAHRHVVDRLVASGALGRGGAVCMVSSAAALGWEAELETLVDFLSTPDFAAGEEWVAAHPRHDHYLFSKQAVSCYVARQSFPLMAQGIRINAVCPGLTDTPLARANAAAWGAFGQEYRDAIGMDGHLSANEVAETMAFLGSDAARGISGVNLLVDRGHLMASLSGSFAPDQPLAEALLGRRRRG